MRSFAIGASLRRREFGFEWSSNDGRGLASLATRLPVASLLLGLACSRTPAPPSPSQVELESPTGSETAKLSQPTQPEITYEHPAVSSPMLEALAQAIRETPYSAVLKHTAVEVLSSTSNEEQHVFRARVVEALRGPKQPSISYVMVTEKGEDAAFTKEPVIVNLCQDQDGYYWPGTGAEFPLTEASLAVARSAAQHLPQGQSSFRSCD